MAWIYLITNLINDKKYVGFTTYTPQKRFKEHSRGSSSPLISKAIKKYGIESFSLTEIYYGFDRDHTLFEMEEFFIRQFNSHCTEGHGYNMSFGGTSNNRGKVYGPEIRKRMGDSRRGKKRPNSGFAISAALKGRTFTEDHKRKLSDANLGKHPTQETLEKMKGPRGAQKNPGQFVCSCVCCKRELDIRGLNNHFNKTHALPSQEERYGDGGQDNE